MNDRKKVYFLDINNSKPFALTRYNYQFDNPIIIIDKKNNENNFICNSKNKIQFFHTSNITTIAEDLYLLIIIWLFFILLFKIIFYSKKINGYKKICFLLSFTTLWICKKLYQFRFFKEKRKYIIIPFELSILVFFVIYIFDVFLFPFIFDKINK